MLHEQTNKKMPVMWGTLDTGGWTLALWKQTEVLYTTLLWRDGTGWWLLHNYNNPPPSQTHTCAVCQNYAHVSPHNLSAHTKTLLLDYLISGSGLCPSSSTDMRGATSINTSTQWKIYKASFFGTDIIIIHIFFLTTKTKQTLSRIIPTLNKRKQIHQHPKNCLSNILTTRVL